MLTTKYGCRFTVHMRSDCRKGSLYPAFLGLLCADNKHEEQIASEARIGGATIFRNSSRSFLGNKQFFMVFWKPWCDGDEWPFTTALATANPVVVARKSRACGWALKFRICGKQLLRAVLWPSFTVRLWTAMSLHSHCLWTPLWHTNNEKKKTRDVPHADGKKNNTLCSSMRRGEGSEPMGLRRSA